MVSCFQQKSNEGRRFWIYFKLEIAEVVVLCARNILRNDRKKLFNDPIVAWRHGPVVVDVYHEYKENGASGIEFDEPFEFSEYNEETNGILEEVYEYFGQYSAWKLRNMTHEERPWKETNLNEEISPEVIRDFFLEEYVE